MSHEVETMFSVREVPWHGEGKILDNPPTSEEAIQAAGLDWTVEAREVFWRSRVSNDRYVPVPERQMLVRASDERPLSVVGRDYQVLQNTEAFKFFDPLITAGIAVYETAGALRSGNKIWILARVKQEFQIGPEDTVRQYVLLCNGHDGNTGILVQPTAIRVVCNNTLMSSLSTGLVYSMAHRGDLSAKMNDAAELIGFTKKRFEEMKLQFMLMETKEITTEQRVDYLKTLIPDAPKNASAAIHNRVAMERDKVLELLVQGKSNLITGFNRGTVWAIYNAAVEFADWYMGLRARDLTNYQLFGRGAIFKRRAMDLAMKMAKGEPLTEPLAGFDAATAAQVQLDNDLIT